MKLLPEINQLDEAKQYSDVFVRDGSKGLAVCGGKLLLLKLNDGTYKIPGGGVKAKETVTQALIREFSEECGISVTPSEVKIVAKIHELKEDKFEPTTIFSHTTYIATLELKSRDIGTQKLDDYEQRLGIQPVWVEFDDVDKCLNSKGPHEWCFRDSRIAQEVLLA